MGRAAPLAGIARLAAAAALATACAGCARAPERPPNLLLYVVDTLRADHVGFLGDPWAVTPRMDAFAAEATVFERAHAPSSWTRASMASLLTGLRPTRHHTEDRADHLPPEVPTLAELLAVRGYRTAYVTANPNAGAFFGFDRGFDEMIELYAPHAETGEKVEARDLIARSGAATDRAIAWLEQGARPFFLVMLTVDPHYPYAPPPEALQAVRQASGWTEEGWREAAARTGWVGPLATARFLVDLRYRAEIAATDASFGRLLDWLDDAGLRDDTVVVLTADHGEGLWDHGRLQHGYDLHEEVLRVPLVIRHPDSDDLPAGGRVERPVRSMDVMPTLLELAGAEPPARLGATSLLGDRGTPPFLYARLDLDGRSQESVLAPPWKLVIDHVAGSELLYDLANDPDEQQPQSAGGGGPAAHARERLEQDLAAVPGRDAAPVSRPARPAPELPEDVHRTLRALGYVE